MRIKIRIRRNADAVIISTACFAVAVFFAVVADYRAAAWVGSLGALCALSAVIDRR